ncbi:MAG TPA: type III-B CRISPR module RAMP protein Cmr4 [Campylobacterales bacterium]|nr:type III-B CRISPR module RAMP protein Cmr4 [Campylobacterales bacterium]
MKTELYIIKALTNLHVGSGDINFDIIDNQVQRDPITNLPNINSSSLKGAFREHFANGDSEAKIMVNYIFGPENQSNDNHQTGAFSFFEAQLLARPVRSNKRSYFNATSPAVIKTFLEHLESFAIDFDDELKKALEEFSNLEPQKGKPLLFENIEGTILEDYKADYCNFDTKTIEPFLGDSLTLFCDEDFKKIDLPVVARNYLVNGESKNLWYEEIVPKKTRFYFLIAKPTNIDPKDYDQKIEGFENRFDKEGEVMQIGANKSIGYGFCKITKVAK